MERKYFKPKSLTWWASLLPILVGLFLALEPWHQLTPLVETINLLTNYASPLVLINVGLAGIGFRGAVGDPVVVYHKVPEIDPEETIP
jgi:deoxyxylulose-5-phosphate synthase